MNADARSEEHLLAVFESSLNRIRSRGIAMVEFRPRSSSTPDAFTGDFDFILDPADAGAVMTVLFEECLRHGVNLTYRRDDANRSVLGLVAGGRSITIDIWYRLELFLETSAKGRHEIEAAAVLARLQSGAGDRYAAAVFAAIFVTHLFYKSTDTSLPVPQERLRHFSERIASTARGEPDDTDDVRRMLDRLIDGSLELAEANRQAVGYLSRQGLHPRRRALLDRMHERLSHWRLPRSIIPVVGPDGCGKTHFCKKLVAEDPGIYLYLKFKNLIRSTFDYWLIQKGMGWIGQYDANVIDEMIAYYIILKSIVLIPVIRHRLIRKSRIAITDRFVWDYLLRNVKRPGGVPARRAMHGLSLRLIPKPRKCFLIICGTETIQSRKQQLTAEQISFLYREYINNITAGYAMRAFFVNSEIDYEQSRADVKAFMAR